TSSACPGLARPEPVEGHVLTFVQSDFTQHYHSRVAFDRLRPSGHWTLPCALKQKRRQVSPPPLCNCHRQLETYLPASAIADEVAVNVAFNWLPMPCIAVIAATAIRAAIRPYSIAVAPSSWRRSFLMNFMVVSWFFAVSIPGPLQKALRTLRH